MILVDANLLLYAQDQTSPRHAQAKTWWDEQLNGRQTVGLCWPVLSAFVRIATNHRVFQRPLTITQACDYVQSWLDRPMVRVVHATGSHWEILRRLLEQSQAVGNLVSDAHLAALAIENGCELYSTDADFARFRGLRWHNPLTA